MQDASWLPGGVTLGLLLVAVVGWWRLTERDSAESRVAAARADVTLRELLTPAEYAQVVERGYLEVPSRSYPGRIYRVPADGSAVVVHQPRTSPLYLCLRPVDRLPGAETVLVHKLLLEAAEEEYWRRANVVGDRQLPGWPGRVML